MDAPAGNITYEGLEAILEGSMTWTHGISPSRATISIIPQTVTVIQSGTLSITYGETSIKFPDCRVINPSIQYDSGGFVGSFIVEDRRWKWRYPTINGWYNQRTPQGEIDTNRVAEKTVQELAKLLLEAMGESNVDVSAMPNKSRPEVYWEEDNAAEELAKLVESVGCLITLKLNNKVVIEKKGKGADLPDNDAQLSQAYGVNAPSRPDKIKLVCGPSRFETVFALEAVGFDPADRRIKPIDDLSYAPKKGNTVIDQFGNAQVTVYDGWGYQKPGIFYDVQSKIETESGKANISNATPDGKACRYWALECVWKWYRIVCTANNYRKPMSFAYEDVPQFRTFTIPDSPVKVKDRKQILPLEDGRIVPEEKQNRRLGTIDYPDPVISQPAHLVGQFVGELGRLEFAKFPPVYKAQTDQNTPIDCDFEIDRELGIVKLSEYRFLQKLDTAGKNVGQIIPAVLFLQVAHPVRDPDTMVPVRYTFEVDLPGTNVGTKSEAIKAEEVVYVSYPKYQDLAGKNTSAPGDTVTNKELVDKYALSYLVDATFRYMQPESKQVTYAGILDIDLTGTIHQVEWVIGDSGCETKASLNTEFKREVPNFAERRRRERQLHAANQESPSSDVPLKQILSLYQGRRL